MPLSLRTASCSKRAPGVHGVYNHRSRSMIDDEVFAWTIDAETILGRRVSFDEAATCVKRGFEIAWGIRFEEGVAWERVEEERFAGEKVAGERVAEVQQLQPDPTGRSVSTP